MTLYESLRFSSLVPFCLTDDGVGESRVVDLLDDGAGGQQVVCLASQCEFRKWYTV